MSKALIVIDVQRCFLPGGSLATGTAETAEKFTQDIYNLIASNKFGDVYLTQDMHHPDNVSMENMYKNENLKNTSKYEPRAPYFHRKINAYNLSKSTRRWGDATQLSKQVLWPRHCILPKDDPYFPEGYTGGKTANQLADGQYGSDLAYALSVFKNAKPADITSNVYTVYKGFDPEKDSYSAIADATGMPTPFISKINGVSQAPGRKGFLEQLKEKELTDIYICGIATDYCVYQTAMDLLDYYVFENKESPRKTKIHYLFDLTRPVVPDAVTPATLKTDVEGFLTKIGVTAPVTQYFVVEDAATMTGGRRRMNKTRKAHMRGCNCKGCWKKMKGGKKTRKPAGHKKGCKCIICKRR